MIKLIIKVFAMAVVAIVGLNIIGLCFNSASDLWHMWGWLVGLAVVIAEILIARSIFNQGDFN